MKCIKCKKELIYIQKRRLCKSCYKRWYREKSGLVKQPSPKKPFFCEYCGKIGVLTPYKSKLKHKVCNKHCRKKLNKLLGVARAKESAIKKYGQVFLDDLELLKAKPFLTLDEVGKKYGITRERIRQLYKIVFGVPYTKAVKKKIKLRNQEIGCPNDPRHKAAEYKPGYSKQGAKTEVRFINECLELGIDVKVPCNKEIDIRVNGYLVDVKSCGIAGITHKSQKIPHRRFVVSKKQLCKAHFIACYHEGQEAFYIVPTYMIPKCRSIYISEKESNHKNAKNRYLPFRNAWHLLQN